MPLPRGAPLLGFCRHLLPRRVFTSSSSHRTVACLLNLQYPLVALHAARPLQKLAFCSAAWSRFQALRTQACNICPCSFVPCDGCAACLQHYPHFGMPSRMMRAAVRGKSKGSAVSKHAASRSQERLVQLPRWGQVQYSRKAAACQQVINILIRWASPLRDKFALDVFSKVCSMRQMRRNGCVRLSHAHAA